MRKASDTNLADTVRHKSMIVDRIKGHRTETEAIDVAEKQDIMYSNVTNGLAKQAATLAPHDIVCTSPASISIPGGEAPGTARKWILKLWRQHEANGVHWVIWRPLKGIRHMYHRCLA